MRRIGSGGSPGLWGESAWGTLSDRLAEYGAAQSARLGLIGRVRIELRDYRDLENESFDKIVSVGIFEHVGRDHLPEYFSQAYRLLKPVGLFLNHGIARHGKLADLALLKGLNTPGQTISGGPAYLEKKVLGQGSFVQHDIFPDTVNLIFRLAVQISMFNDARLCEL